MIDTRPVLCRRCGGPTDVTDVVVRHPPSDPLVVSECAGCGAIVGVGAHR